MYCIQKITNHTQVYTHCIYTSPNIEFNTDYISIGPDINKKINNGIFKIIKDDNIPENILQLNLLQRKYLNIILNENIIIEPINKNEINIIEDVTFLVKNKTNTINHINEEIKTRIIDSVKDIPIINNLELCPYKGIIITPININLVTDKTKVILNGGFITNETKITFLSNDSMTIIDDDSTTHIFNKNFNFIDMGIGGLNKEFEIIFRRAFSTRLIPSSILNKVDIKHVKGIILYGLPGTGKTLIAKKIGEILNCEKPIIVNGPSLLSSYIGKSEENVRKLFENAIQDKSNKKLHLIILDEFDSLVRTRGQNGPDSSINDKIVNQFLTMIDGPESLNNILLIAMTNRIDIIDEALLRPGRFEIQIEIKLPNEEARKEILEIHLKNFDKHNYLENIDISEIAKKTINFTGAELEGVIKNALSYNITNQLDINNIDSASISPLITQNDLLKSITEIIPQFGNNSNEINIYTSKKFELYSTTYKTTYDKIMDNVNNLNYGNLISILIYGDNYIGKTTLACHIAKNSNYKCIKFVNYEKIINNSKTLYDIFTEGYKSDSLLLILDSIELLIEYSNIGIRCNNKNLQYIFAILNKIIDNNKKISIILTSSNPALMNELELTDKCSFSYYLENENNIKEYLFQQNNYGPII